MIHVNCSWENGVLLRISAEFKSDEEDEINEAVFSWIQNSPQNLLVYSNTRSTLFLWPVSSPSMSFNFCHSRWMGVGSVEYPASKIGVLFQTFFKKTCGSSAVLKKTWTFCLFSLKKSYTNLAFYSYFILIVTDYHTIFSWHVEASRRTAAHLLHLINLSSWQPDIFLLVAQHPEMQNVFLPLVISISLHVHWWSNGM